MDMENMNKEMDMENMDKDMNMENKDMEMDIGLLFAGKEREGHFKGKKSKNSIGNVGHRCFGSPRLLI